MDIEALMEKYGDNILRLCYLYLLSAGWGTGGGRGPGDLCPGLAESGGLSGGIQRKDLADQQCCQCMPEHAPVSLAQQTGGSGDFGAGPG